MSHDKKIMLTLGQIHNLLKTKTANQLLNQIFLRHDRCMDVSISNTFESTFHFEVDKEEINEILSNMEFLYKKSKLPSIIIHREFLIQSPIHKNGCPLTYEEWIDSLINEMELTKDEKDVFDEWNKIVKIPYSGSLI